MSAAYNDYTVVSLREALCTMKELNDCGEMSIDALFQCFHPIFCSLENEGLLDPLNEADLYCLHFIFLPRINQCIRDFTESWNHHPLSTEGNMTPYQLFYEGLLQTEEQQLLNTATVDTSQFEGEHTFQCRE